MTRALIESRERRGVEPLARGTELVDQMLFRRAAATPGASVSSAHPFLEPARRSDTRPAALCDRINRGEIHLDIED